MGNGGKSMEGAAALDCRWFVTALGNRRHAVVVGFLSLDNATLAVEVINEVTDFSSKAKKTSSFTFCR